uniref:dual specificity tyrosine-phosphorylation-regulated kinase 4-like n=1 Tax=Styela clava TaxID=7725 RepID=UPI00193985A2|nr:dual specificity tyrosine-phosphorylation-regulated kinase 4-like [Styela clava]
MYCWHVKTKIRYALMFCIFVSIASYFTMYKTTNGEESICTETKNAFLNQVGHFWMAGMQKTQNEILSSDENLDPGKVRLDVEEDTRISDKFCDRKVKTNLDKQYSQGDYDVIVVKSPNRQLSIPGIENDPHFAATDSFFEDKLENNFLDNDEERNKTIDQKGMKVDDEIIHSNRSQTFPLIPEDALLIFGDELTPWEKREIMKYEKIWYVGEGANKTEAQQEADNNYGFDIESGKYEGHYKVVLNDHIAYRYQILKNLGMGNGGTTVKVLDHSNNEFLAIKILVNSTARGKDLYMRELGIMKYIESNATNKNYFSRMFNTIYFRNHYCIVQELLGDSLHDIYSNRPVESLDLLRRFSSDIMHAMYYLSELNIFHSDLKLQNIMFLYGKNDQSEGQLLKVGDFDLSCVPHAEDFFYRCPEGVVFQPLYCRSPESLLNLPVSSQSDMFSLGVIMAQLFLGTPLFIGRDEVDQFAAMMEVIGLPPAHIISQAKEIYARAISYATRTWFRRIPGKRPLDYVLRDIDPLLFDLISECLEWDADIRITPKEALLHPFFTKVNG